MTDIVIRADRIVYWGDTGRLLQQVAQLLGVSPDNVTIEIVGTENAGTTAVKAAQCPTSDYPNIWMGGDWDLPFDGMPE